MVFLKCCPESRKILVQVQKHFHFKAISVLKKETLLYGKPTMTCFKYQMYLYGSEAITYLNAVPRVQREEDQVRPDCSPHPLRWPCVSDFAYYDF
jgi:hypothetical protein